MRASLVWVPGYHSFSKWAINKNAKLFFTRMTGVFTVKNELKRISSHLKNICPTKAIRYKLVWEQNMCFVNSIFAHILKLMIQIASIFSQKYFCLRNLSQKALGLSTPTTGFKKIQPNRNMTKARRHYRFPGKQQCDDIKGDTDQTW